MFAKVAKLGAAVVEVYLDEGASVGSALRAAEMQAGNFQLRVNNEVVDAEHLLSDNDVITLVPEIKGGQIFVRVAKLGTKTIEIYVDEDTTVDEALETAGVDSAGLQVRVNNEPVTDETELVDGDVITLVPAIKGG